MDTLLFFSSSNILVFDSKKMVSMALLFSNCQHRFFWILCRGLFMSDWLGGAFLSLAKTSCLGFQCCSGFTFIDGFYFFQGSNFLRMGLPSGCYPGCFIA